MAKEENEKLNFAIQYKQHNCEQEQIRSYVLTKPLLRPKTNALNIIVMIVCYCLLCVGVSLFILHYVNTYFWIEFILVFSIWALMFWINARNFFIKLIECYQHYAKESTRRKCLCMPTCSEYAIEVLKKHCLIVALLKIRKRLFVTCRNGIYKIDLP